ncbi:tetratricopeptide repeat protein [Daejeonella oryzae]|uniref:tetratricopeptide repeat protein n=1 Tax=Daejeonella oryzae TaxID=1122943 RepID=UPI0009DBBD6F|nr:tetratricopeptide repeat protein [Daejeonella oryzae]
MHKVLSIVVFLFLSILTSNVEAQSLIKEAMNSFARFNRSHDIKDLELSRKKIDEAYKTPKDSLSFKNNLTKGLIYSTLAHLDSNRKYEYTQDPAIQALDCLNKLNDNKLSSDFKEEISYIKSRLSKSYLYQSKKHLSYYDYSGAVTAFKKIDSLTGKNNSINHNIALLHQRIGNTTQAIEYYKDLIKDSPNADYFLMLSYLYELSGEDQLALNIMQKGRLKFPDNKDMIFYELNYFAEKKLFDKVSELIPKALKLDEYNTDINYLAGFSFEVLGNSARAEEFYEKVLNIKPNNYDANYALGLLYLTSYAMDSNKIDLLFKAKQFLLTAMEIDPNQLKTLQSLAVLYNYTADENQLRKINNKINQLKLN